VRHKVVIAPREVTYPFRAFWMCVCGHRFNATYMGSPLYKEFKAHQDEEKKREQEERNGKRA
jgi:hypothetical protein